MRIKFETNREMQNMKELELKNRHIIRYVRTVSMRMSGIAPTYEAGGHDNPHTSSTNRVYTERPPMEKNDIANQRARLQTYARPIYWTIAFITIFKGPRHKLDYIG